MGFDLLELELEQERHEGKMVGGLEEEGGYLRKGEYIVSGISYLLALSLKRNLLCYLVLVLVLGLGLGLRERGARAGGDILV